MSSYESKRAADSWSKVQENRWDAYWKAKTARIKDPPEWRAWEKKLLALAEKLEVAGYGSTSAKQEAYRRLRGEEPK